MKKGNVVMRILGLLKARKKMVFFLVALVLFSASFDIVVPFVSQYLIDTLVDFFKSGTGAPVKILALSAVAILFATILNRVLKSLYDYYLFITVTKTEDSLRVKTFEKYLKLHTLFHHGSSSGQIIGRLDRGAMAIWAILYDIFGQNLLPPLVTFVTVFVALMTKNIWIGAIVFFPFPLYLLAIRSLTQRIYEIEKEVNEKFENVAKESYDVASNVLTVKKFSQEEEETLTLSRLLGEGRHIQYSAERLWAVVENIQTLISTVGRISVIVVAGFFVLKGISTIGEFVLYITLQNMAYAPLWQLSVVFPRLRRNMSRVERMFSVMDEDIKVIDKENAVDLPPLRKKIEFENVWFQYKKGKRWSIKDSSVVIPVNTTVALVGRSGSGKTTFINLLLRSFDPQRGSIVIDGHDLRDITQKSLRDQIAVVPQEVDLFSRTIADNISYGKTDTSKREIVEAAKIALAHDFIMKTEDGYETLVGERGIKLSGGERQRIGIARAVLRNPRILILDEATSHLDTESEKLIQEASRSIMKNRTTFIIAHRLSTILSADTILVFSHGEIEAVGSHEELMRKSPTYKHLYSLQFHHLKEELPYLKNFIPTS